MDLDTTFPRRVFISRRDRDDRRRDLLPRLSAAGLLGAEWFPAIEADVLGADARGFHSVPKRSLALGKRLLLRDSGRRGFPSLLILEDDAVFHPEFKERAQQLELPADWGIFYFGCQHIERPEPIAPGLVRVRRGLDTHAFAVRAKYFMRVRAAMRGAGKGVKGELHSDVLLSSLHQIVPTYAAFPNLAWQATSYSDLTGKVYSNYDEHGWQRFCPHAVAGLGEPAN